MTFVRGDANLDGSTDLADALEILFVLFGGETASCRDAADANDDGKLDLSDAMRVLEYLYRDGPPPAAPFPDRGIDPPSGLSLGCSKGI